jgi:flavin-binding protein dodecin
MAMLKVIEVLAESQTSWEDATQVAVSQATESVRNIRLIYIKTWKLTSTTDALPVIASTQIHLLSWNKRSPVCRQGAYGFSDALSK